MFVALCSSFVGCYFSRSVDSNTWARVDNNGLLLYIMLVSPRVLIIRSQKAMVHQTCLDAMGHLVQEAFSVISIAHRRRACITIMMGTALWRMIG